MKKKKEKKEMVNNLTGRSEDIVKVTFWFNVVMLVLSILFYRNLYILMTLAINCLLLGSFMILGKYHYVFEGMINTNHKTAKSLNSMLGKLK